jgi:hypothetical protein
MISKPLFSILFLMAFFAGSLFSEPKPEPIPPPIPWPLSCEPAMTSAFGDYRPGHFHSGVDMKTWGKVGIPILSEGDGYVSRVSIATRGYGRALYIKLNSGGYRVYGHLSEFGHGIDAQVEKEQYAKKRYAVQLYFKEGQVPVKKGQEIAKSGESGVGFPHLHFEVRTDSNVPENALKHGIRVQDHRKPVLEILAIKPFLLGSMVGESDETVLYPLVKSAGDTFRLKAPVPFYGCIGLAVKGHDEADAAENHFGIYSLELYFDDSLVFKSARDSFEFEVTQEIHLDYDFKLICDGQGAFYNLYHEEGNKLPLYGRFAEGAGLIRMASAGQPGVREGKHVIRIVAADAAGNRACATADLVCVKPPVVERVESEQGKGPLGFLATLGAGAAGLLALKVQISTDGNHWKEFKPKSSPGPEGLCHFSLDSGLVPGFYLKAIAVDSGGNVSAPFIIPVPGKSAPWGDPQIDLQAAKDVLHVVVRAPGFLPAAPAMAVFADSARLEVPPLRSREAGVYESKFRTPFQGQKTLRIVLSMKEEKGGLKVYKKEYPVCALVSGRACTAISQDGRALIDVPVRGVIGNACLWILPAPDSILRKEIKEIRFCGQAYAPVPNSIFFDRQIRMAISAPRQKGMGLFTYAGDNGWTFFSDEYDDKKTCYFGTVLQGAIFGLFTDTTKPSIALKTPARDNDTVKGHEIVLIVKDEGAGIGSDKDVITLIDNEWRLNEYDFELNTVTASLKGVARGRHVMTVIARDNLKNENKLDFAFNRL